MVDTGFPRSVRLLKQAEYQRVFSQATRYADKYLTILARKNDQAPARLGLAVSKKNARRAVDRNRLKRLIRESFRRHQQQLAGLDLVVMIRTSAVSADNQKIDQSLDTGWKEIRA